MKNIHIIPTNKPSRLTKNNLGRFIKLNGLQHQEVNENQNIYITNDEPIKAGDWVYCRTENRVLISNVSYSKLEARFKIILTTDQDLIKDGVQSIDDEFLEWFVKNPSCDEVEVKKEYITPLGDIVETCYDNERLNYKIIIPKEIGFKVENGKRTETFYQEPKQGTLEEAAEKYADFSNDYVPLAFAFGSKFNETTKRDFIAGAKWQAERMYSEQDLREAFKGGGKMSWTDINQETQEPYYYDFNEWFEQFKKKQS